MVTMSRGAWIALIGLILIIAGVVLGVLSVLPLITGIDTTPDLLTPGEYLNRTITLERGEALTYFVQIQDYTQGDQVTISVRLPSGLEVNETVVTTQQYTNVHVANVTGSHAVVIQNTGSGSVTVLHFATTVGATTGILLLAALAAGFVGFLVLIVGIVLWVVDRRKPAPQRPM